MFARVLSLSRTIVVLAGISTMLLLNAVVLGQDKPSDEWKVPASKTRVPNPSAASPENINTGKALYERECLACHGATGRGDGPGAKDLEKKPGDLTSPNMWNETDGSLFFRITVGRRPMPSFREKFSDEQRWQIIDYVRTLTLKDVKPLAASAATRSVLSEALKPYGEVEAALINGQLDAATKAAAALAKSVETIKGFDGAGLPDNLKAAWTTAAANLDKAQKALAAAPDLDAARNAFGSLSFNLQIALRFFGHAEAQPARLYQSQQTASHESALWLQMQETPGDPYVGKDKQGRLVANILPG